MSGPLTRRAMFRSMSGGIGAAALAHLMGGGTALGPADDSPRDLAPRAPHFAPKATSVIHLFMNGGPSQMDLFDPKPMLDRHHGQSYFDKIAGEVENPQSAGALMRSPFSFRRRGQSGMWVSDAMPHLATRADDIALIRS